MNGLSTSDSAKLAMEQLNALEKQVIEQIDADEVVAFLQELIRARSDHPPGDCREALALVAARLRAAGIAFEVRSRQEHQPNLIATLGLLQERADLMLHAHIDTVSAGERERWAVEPFGGLLREGRVYGRGAGDDKGSVVAQVMACLALARAGMPLPGCLRLVVVSDEESGGLQGTRWLHGEGSLQTRALVVGEQTENHIAITERVACGIDLTVYGTSAHGATPWEGENAILKTARVLTWLEARFFPKLDARRHPYLPPPTLNIGRIQGGTQWSIVPERCIVEMDRRLIPGETREQAVVELQELLDEYAATVEPLRFELFSSGEVAANIDTPPDDPFVVLANRTLSNLTGENRPLTGYVQTSDGRWLARDGIPIFIFGPGHPSAAHAADEYIPVEQLLEAVRFLAVFALRWLGSQAEPR